MRVAVFYIFYILYPLYIFPLSPGLLDALHPLVAVGLFLRAELQRFLAIVSKYDEEVVLQNRKQFLEIQIFIIYYVKISKNTALLCRGAYTITRKMTFKKI